MEEITPDKKVIKKVLKAGEGYEKPNDGSTVKCEPTCDATLFNCRCVGCFWKISLVKSSRGSATFSSCMPVVSNCFPGLFLGSICLESIYHTPVIKLKC